MGEVQRSPLTQSGGWGILLDGTTPSPALTPQSVDRLSGGLLTYPRRLRPRSFSDTTSLPPCLSGPPSGSHLLFYPEIHKAGLLMTRLWVVACSENDGMEGWKQISQVLLTDNSMPTTPNTQRHTLSSHPPTQKQLEQGLSNSYDGKRQDLMTDWLWG